MPETTSKIALAIITRGDERPDIFRQCLDSVSRYVDGIFITITTPTPADSNETVETVAKEYGAHYEVRPDEFFYTVTAKDYKKIKKVLGYGPVVQKGDRVFQFDQARNYNFSQVPKEFDWILWLDADDVIRNGQKLREVVWIAENNQPQPAESVFMNYIYLAEFDHQGNIKNVIIEHLREQLVRNNGVYKWVAPIHETLIEQRPTVKIDTKLVDRLHCSNVTRMENAIKRNIVTLELLIMQTNCADPRPIYYLGKALYDLNTSDDTMKAQKFFNAYLLGTENHEYQNKSGWPEERAQCWEYMGDTCRRLGKHNNALKAYMNSLIECDKFPTTYLSIALAYLILGKWESAIRWVEIAAHIKQPTSTLVSNPRDEQMRALEILYLAQLQLSQLDKSRIAAHKMLDLAPDNQEFQQRVQFVDQLYDQRETTQAIIKLAQHLQSNHQEWKLRPLLTSVPDSVVNNPFLAKMRQQVFPPRQWQDNEIAIFCGPGFTQWSPKSLETPGVNFVGGSEEAVIYLSEELTQLGWKVVVFGDPGADSGEHNGVDYLPFYEFNLQDSFNILISWRRIEFFDQPFKAKKKYMWAHDVLNPLAVTKERAEKIDKVIVLSPWHRTNIADVPDDKIMISNNGIRL